MPSALSYYTLFVGVAVIMTHLRGAESFTLRRIASSSTASVKDSQDFHEKTTAIDRPERSREHTRIKTTAVAGGYEGGRLVQRSPATGNKRRDAHSDVPSDQFDLSDQVEAVVSIQIVKQDLPGIVIVEQKDNDIHADLEYRPRKIHYLPANQIPLGQQWHLVKQFIMSDYYFGKLDELTKAHFLQKMLRGLISQSQKNEYK